MLRCQLLAEMQSTRRSSHSRRDSERRQAGAHAAEVVVGQYSSFEPHAEDLLGQLDSCRWSENAERERA